MTAPDPPAVPGDLHAWRGNFLAFPGFEYAFMYPGWPADKRQRFREAYRAAGYTHLPIGVWGSYGAHPSFDYRGDVEGYRRILTELRTAFIHPCVFVHTDAVGSIAPFPLEALASWARGYLPQIADLVALWCTGFEFAQIDQTWDGYWTGDGTEHLRWAHILRTIVGSAATIYCHFPPERITGWPNYPHHDGPQEEEGWWHAAGDVLDGLLYQRWPTEPEPFVLAHTIGGTSQDGSTDMGDAQRIAGGAWGIHKRFVFFEHSRDVQRHARLVAAVKDDPRIDGYC